MRTSPIFRHIHFDDFSITPKYIQLANGIIKAINDGKLKIGDVLPSINELSFHFEISRDTAEKGYKHLKAAGIISSVPGKGFFVSNAHPETPSRIFLMFNKLSPHKKIIYDSFVRNLGDQVWIDFYIYNNDLALFKKLLEQAHGDYSHYVIIPHFIEGEEQAPKLINQIDKSKLILLDKEIPGLTGDFSVIHESFESDIYGALEQALDRLKNYHTLKLIFPENSYYPEAIADGFITFCKQYAFEYAMVHDITSEKLGKGEVYINLMDNDLVVLIEKILMQKMKVGKDVGVISYNETPLKKIILSGITTISTDFEMMGIEAANIIKTGKQKRMSVPFKLTLRNSL